MATLKVGLSERVQSYSYLIDKELRQGNVEPEILFFQNSSMGIKQLKDHKINLFISESKNYNHKWFFANIYEGYPYNVIIYGNPNSNRAIAFPFLSFSGNDNSIVKRIKNKELQHSNYSEIKKLALLNKENFYALILPGKFFVLFHSYFDHFPKEQIEIIPAEKAREGVYFIYDNEILPFINQIREKHIKPIYFVGVGIGTKEFCTKRAIETLKDAEICLYDKLIDFSILDIIPSRAKKINVGKRCKKHSLNQSKINELIVNYANEGYRVVRLKSGDPAIFGRLAEEVKYVTQQNISFKILPGLSSLNVLSYYSNIVLTKRRLNRGFCVMSPIKHGGEYVSVTASERKKLPLILFMSVRVIDKVSKDLINDGISADTPSTMIFDMGKKTTIIKGNLNNIAEKIKSFLKDINEPPPGILIIGKVAYLSKKFQLPFINKTVLIGANKNNAEYFQAKIKDLGGEIVYYELADSDIDLEILKNVSLQLSKNKSIVAVGEKKLLNLIVPLITELSAENIILTPTNINSLPSGKIRDKIYYIFTSKSNPDFIKCIKNKTKIKEIQFIKIPKNRKLKIKENIDLAVFFDAETFWHFIEGVEKSLFFLRHIPTYIPEDNEIESFLKKKGIAYSVLPKLFYYDPFYLLKHLGEKSYRKILNYFQRR